jgi:ArsR family transcriptional regulator
LRGTRSHEPDGWPDILKVLGHPLRFEIVRRLVGEEKCVHDLWTALEMHQAVVSQHLAVLRKGGIVGCRRNGNRIRYYIKSARVRRLMGVVDSDRS